jgi:hypothetical protein
VKPDYLMDPRFAVALLHRDELLAEASKARLVAQARAGNSRPPKHRVVPAYVVLALVVILVAAGIALP